MPRAKKCYLLLDPKIHKAFKIYAIETDQDMTVMGDEAVREYMERKLGAEMTHAMISRQTDPSRDRLSA
jgi:hypothetical protein